MRAEDLFTRICSAADIEVNGPRAWDIQVHDKRFFKRVITNGSLGMGESYVMGWWDCEDLVGLLSRLLASKEAAKHEHAGLRTAVAFLQAQLTNVQSTKQSHRLAKAHYDLSNEMFEHMLGKSMAYSCGYWDGAKCLDDAQHNKLELICRKLHLQNGDRVLDVGCGWGSFAKFAAERFGCEVFGITVAKEQSEYARKFCAGLSVEIWCGDYRQFGRSRGDAQFDKIVAIETLEHVGYRNYRTFMEFLHQELRSAGRVLLQTAGSNETTRVSDPWVTKYIFPGGKLPSMMQLASAAEKLFVMEHVENIGEHYAKTLGEWHANFMNYCNSVATEQLPPKYSGSSEAFVRMWRYYLLLSRANFQVRHNPVWQLVLSKL